MKYRLLKIICILMLPIFLNCSKSDDSVPELTQELLISSFSVRTPDNWEWEQDQGIDTFIGRIYNGEDTIFFDQGYLSFGYLEDVDESDRTISFQRTTINGVPAIIEKAKTSDEEISRDIRLSVYLDEGEAGRQNRLYTYDPIDEKAILAIYRSHKFLARVD